MDNKEFVHLHVHNEFSILDGFGSAEDYLKEAKEMGFTHLGLTNHGNIDGLIKFQEQAEKEGITPILGCELYVVPDIRVKQKGERRGHMTVLLKNETGWRELCRLLTIANIDGFYWRPRIGFEDILNADLSGWVIMTGCCNSFLTLDGGEQFFFDLVREKKADIYFEIMPHDIEDQHKLHNEVMVGWSVGSEVPMVATNDCHYVRPGDWKAHEVLLAIQTGAKWDDERRYKFDFYGLHLRSAEEMEEAFEYQGDFCSDDYRVAMVNSLKIAKKCGGFHIPTGRDIALPWDYNEGDPDMLFEELCCQGMERWMEFHEPGEFIIDEYRGRLKEEMELIKSKGFAVYFLIVIDVIAEARNRGIPVGPGRGSVGGSLVAYFLGITQIDPLKYDLLFSRFIAEHRNDYPDIDIDFGHLGRDEVKEYIQKKYGFWNTAMIGTFGTMKAKGVLRSVSRVFNVEKEVDEFAKAINDKDKDKFKVVKYAEETEEGRAFDSKYPEIVDYASLLENQISQVGQHAAGMIVSAEDLRDGGRCVLCRRKAKSGGENIVSTWDMEDTEKVGLMKLDILGVNVLSVIYETVRLVKENQKKDIILEKIPLDDDKVFKDIADGNTVGIFQFSGWATRKVGMEIGVDCFNDMVAAVALSRPGPMDSGMTDDYINRKFGSNWNRKHRIYEEITHDTYGVIVYQEQVMKVIAEVAGLSYSVADKIRKIIGKKRDAAEFKPYWESFWIGCKKMKTMTKEEAEEFWEGLQAHANYSFNKSHSVGYALLAYWGAWLRVHYPVEYICAALSYGSEKEAKKNDVVKSALESGLKVIPPKVGISEAIRWKVIGEKLYAPFKVVKNIGDSDANKCCGIFESNSCEGGFFSAQEIAGFSGPTRLEGSLGDTLNLIKAYNPDDCVLSEDALKLFEFDFDIVVDEQKYERVIRRRR